MAKKKEKVKSNLTFTEALSKSRGSWGLVNPVSRIERDKTKIIPRKQKYKEVY